MEDFERVDIRIGNITKAEPIPKADKLLRLEVDIGGETRQLVAGVAKHYTLEELVGKQIAVIVNLKPAKIMGVESQGMLLAGDDGENISILSPDKPVKPGSKVS